MEKASRRFAMRAAAAGAVAVGSAVLGGTAWGDDRKAPKLWTLEGELKVHPKFLYRYYLVLLGTGQICALFGADHGREQEQLARLKLPIGVKVRGVLGTEYHDGGTKDNPSAFPAAWTLYMDVHEVEPLKIDFSPKPQPGLTRGGGNAR
jgi:hypothetical protein